MTKPEAVLKFARSQGPDWASVKQLAELGLLQPDVVKESLEDEIKDNEYLHWDGDMLEIALILGVSVPQKVVDYVRTVKKN